MDSILLIFFKDGLSVLKQFLATESRLKIMKNAFYFTLKAFFVLKIFTASLSRSYIKRFV